MNALKVWIVEYDYDYEGTQIAGIFSTEEKAREWMAGHTGSIPLTEPDECTVDPVRVPRSTSAPSPKKEPGTT